MNKSKKQKTSEYDQEFNATITDQPTACMDPEGAGGPYPPKNHKVTKPAFNVGQSLAPSESHLNGVSLAVQ